MYIVNIYQGFLLFSKKWFNFRIQCGRRRRRINERCWKSSPLEMKRWKMPTGWMINDRKLITERMIHSRTHCSSEIFRWFPFPLSAARLRIVARCRAMKWPKKIFRAPRREAKDDCEWGNAYTRARVSTHAQNFVIRTWKLRSICVNNTQVRR